MTTTRAAMISLLVYLASAGLQQGWFWGTPLAPGPRTVVILHETAETTPELSQLIVSLRSGPNAEYLASKGHRLLILDDDAKGVDGQPAPLVAKLNALAVPPPSLFVLSGDQVLMKGSLPPQAKADGVLNVLKGAGG